MLRSLKEIFGYDIHAVDGKFGTASDFYFDDNEWIVRYLVVDSGNILARRLVLISPQSIDTPKWTKAEVPVELTKDQINNSPDISTDLPISRQYETKLTDYYKWPVYWGLGHPAGAGLVTPAKTESKDEEDTDPNLRSTSEVINYNISALDEDIGHIEDFVVDDETWNIRYAVVDTSNWLPLAKKVLISPAWIKSIDWKKEIVDVDLKKQTIKESPEFDPTKPINREYEVRLYDYYGRPKYWI